MSITAEMTVLDENKVVINKTIADMVTYAQNLVVDNEQAFKSITGLYRHARDWKKLIDEKRKHAIEPSRKYIATINDKAKELTDPLTTVEEIAKKKSAGYQAMLEQIKVEEQKRIREAAAMLDLGDDLYLAPVEKTLRGDGAISYTTMETKFRVADISKVPVKYLQVNEQAIKNDLKLGLVEIPGIDIYKEEVTRLKSR